MQVPCKNLFHSIHMYILFLFNSKLCCKFVYSLVVLCQNTVIFDNCYVKTVKTMKAN